MIFLGIIVKIIIKTIEGIRKNNCLKKALDPLPDFTAAMLYRDVNPISKRPEIIKSKL